MAPFPFLVLVWVGFFLCVWVVFFLSACFFSVWEESCADLASVKQSTMCKAFFYTFSKAFTSLIMVILYIYIRQNGLFLTMPLGC